jgi:hypothetical protein
MNQALYAHMNNKRKRKKKDILAQFSKGTNYFWASGQGQRERVALFPLFSF